MEENLKKVEAWLLEHANKIATYSLQSGATVQELKELEEEFGDILPDDFKQLYLWHNGMSDDENMGNLFYGMEFCSLEKVIRYFRDNKSQKQEKYPLQQVDRGIDASDIYNENWIMFGHDGSRTKLYIDLKPTSAGTRGQVIFIDEEAEVGILVANSIEELIEKFVSDLSDGLYELNEDALEDDEHFLEVDQSVDLVNWSMSDEWQRE
ncbi:MAG: SMI1/KNR4 family protein [Flavobacteriaceae bacterium]|jgi:cell wall assembly regulator SMI1|nr:SMI1/KNR4 family protein [Flavobacteriaceae bacterium]